ncbi:hypothetical protein [Solirubrum puertoriconensis]|uniref:Uncharacterized protein n=1 Tax=Solirubrum puertoriconensis TaxID=1751427 RepID=A0A9X0HPC6_SOLP1|nr:hypothetical protein [Solirubrum puertoriconensis]KUG09723.1 hypothetical protein ASU33_18745 [Solirubrum puertoriconensis]
MRIEELIPQSGDSVLNSYRYLQGQLCIELDVPELEQAILIQVETDQISVNNLALTHNEVSGTCYVALIDLSIVLAIENGIYRPNPHFGNMMQEVRRHYHLAYGQRQSEAKMLLTLRGSSTLLSCLIADAAAVTVRMMGSKPGPDEH